jgi:ribonuclease HI
MVRVLWGLSNGIKGEVIAGMSCTLENVLSVATVEALALLRGLEFLEELGCSSVIIESDS